MPRAKIIDVNTAKRLAATKIAKKSKTIVDNVTHQISRGVANSASNGLNKFTYTFDMTLPNVDHIQFAVEETFDKNGFKISGDAKTITLFW